ncbi:hypothetical protein SUDANB171_03032 [Streptomyces sp. enrichment culture]|uniref:hypothetical protein n=1 Tax=Streptomyces xiamenensis TaxID=408015 RepID=UPI0037D4FFFF
MSGSPVPPVRERRSIPLAVTVSAWAAPLLVLTGFAFVAFVPVLIVLIGSLARTRDTAVRAGAVLLAVVYAIPFAIWQLRPDGAPSLSKDIHPGFIGLIVAAAIALLCVLHGARRR